MKLMSLEVPEPDLRFQISPTLPTSLPKQWCLYVEIWFPWSLGS